MPKIALDLTQYPNVAALPTTEPAEPNARALKMIRLEEANCFLMQGTPLYIWRPERIFCLDRQGGEQPLVLAKAKIRRSSWNFDIAMTEFELNQVPA